jgi:hypothetical protein
MFKHALLFFLTLVQVTSLAHGASVAPQPDLHNPHSEVTTPPDDADDRGILSTTDIAPAPLAPIEADPTLERQFFWRQAVSPRAGIQFDEEKIAPGYIPDIIFGFAYLFPSETAEHWEATVDLQPDGSGTPGFGRVYFFNEHQFLHPFIRGGLKTRFIPSEQMATFVNIENLQVAGSFGIEDQLYKKIFAHIEMEVALGPRFRTLTIMAGAACWYY